MPQVPPAHDGVLCGTLQMFEQVPHADVVVVRSTSQPSAGLPLQSAKPALHAAMVQPPLLHAARALARVHAVPQLPQLVVLEPRFASQPSAALPLQSA